MLLVIDDLREIARCCQEGEPIDERLTRWLGGALERFLTQDTRSLEEAMGLQAPQGGVPWHLEEALRKRDAKNAGLTGDETIAVAGASFLTEGTTVRPWRE